MKPSPIETDGMALPKLTTAKECNKSDTTPYYENSAKWKYFILNIYNTGDCPIQVQVNKAIKTPQMVQLTGTDILGPITSGTQYTFVFNAPDNDGVFRLIIKCLGGTPSANSCKYNFRFYGGAGIAEKDWKKLNKIDACDSLYNSLLPKTSQNVCITDEKVIWTFRNNSDAEMNIEFSIRNKGLCPFTFKIDNKVVKRDHDTPAEKIKQTIKKNSIFTVSGFCNYINQQNGSCVYELSSIKIK